METIFEVGAENKGKRLDVFLQENCPEISRSRVKNLIDEDAVLLNQKTPQKSGVLLKTGDRICINIPENKPLEAKPENIPLDIVFEDEYLAIINKPQGMVVHAGSGNFDKTLVNALLFHIKDLSGINGVLRPGIVHRLDKNTAGLLVVAKNDFAHRSLAKQIEEKTAKREYLAVVEGHLKQHSGMIETNISRHKKNRKIMAVCGEAEGKKAITEFEVLQEFLGYSLVKFNLKTGRTHQIRVHCKDFLRHAIAGDIEYGGAMPKCLTKNDKKSLGQYLVAKKLEFIHPKTLKKMSFEVDLPDYFKDFLSRLEIISKKD